MKLGNRQEQQLKLAKHEQQREAAESGLETGSVQLLHRFTISVTLRFPCDIDWVFTIGMSLILSFSTEVRLPVSVGMRSWRGTNPPEECRLTIAC